MRYKKQFYNIAPNVNYHFLLVAQGRVCSPEQTAGSVPHLVSHCFGSFLRGGFAPTDINVLTGAVIEKLLHQQSKPQAATPLNRSLTEMTHITSPQSQVD
jgi:hypothetical protein